MLKNKKFIFGIFALLLLVVIVIIFTVSKNSGKISTNIKLSDDVINTVRDKDMQETLKKYIIAEIELYNNNEKNTVIEQTDETNKFIDKIMEKTKKEDIFDLTTEERRLLQIYLGITEISRTMLLEQPVIIEMDDSSISSISGKKLKLTDEQYEEYMGKVKESIEKVLNEYCK